MLTFTNDLEDQNATINEENSNKCSILNNDLDMTTLKIDSIKNDFIEFWSRIDYQKYEVFFNNEWFNELNNIRKLLDKIDYSEPISANIYLDEVDERITDLKYSISNIDI